MCVFFCIDKGSWTQTIYFVFHQDMFSCTSVPFSLLLFRFEPDLCVSNVTT